MPGDDISPILMKVAKVIGKVVPGLPGQKLSSASISRDPAVVKAYDDDPLVFRGAMPAGIGGAMLRTMDTFPSRLPSLRLPLLVMSGTDDKLVNPEGAKLVDRLAGSTDKTLKMYDGLYHEIFNEPEQELVLGDMADWLKAHLAAN